MVAQFAEKLDAQQSVKRHEEEEEQCDIVNLLPRTPVKSKISKKRGEWDTINVIHT